MQTKQQALAAIIKLMREHSITVNDIKKESPDLMVSNRVDYTKKFLAFVGGIFLLCGIGIYIVQQWQAMNSVARVIITLGTGIVLYILAIVAASDLRYTKIITPLFLIAILFETIGMYVLIHEFSPGWHDIRYINLFVTTVLGIQQILTLLKINNAALIFALMWSAILFFITVLDLLSVNNSYIGIIIGISTLLVAYALANLHYKTLAAFWYFIGSALLLLSTFDLFQGKSYEFIYIGVSAFIIYLSTAVMSRTLLFNGSVAMVAYISYFSSKHFVNSVGWPITLIICGAVILAISALAFNIGKSIK